MDYPVTYSPDPEEFESIRHLARARGLIIKRSRDSGLELSGDGWQLAEELIREIQMSEKSEKIEFLSTLNTISRGDVNDFVETMNVAKELGIPREKAFNFVRYFVQKGMIILGDDAGSSIRITAEGIDEVERHQTISAREITIYGDEVFIVHGHDEEMKQTVARFIEKMGPKAVILHELPNAGRTIIEKFEDYSKVGFAVVLFSPDDLGACKDNKNELRLRARQNVVLELGYFIGKLGRRRVCVLYREGVEMPSDYSGVIYVKYDGSGVWKNELAREFQEASIKIDLSNLLK